jgi:hypothetical protein
VEGGGFSEWSRHARLANASFGEDPHEEELREIVDTLKAENVTVIEVDTNLSEYLTDEEFEQSMVEASQFNRLVHGAGLRVVWYYPSLEVSTRGGEEGPSFFKTYPDWVQISVDGEPNVFYGGVVFWIDPGSESAWLSPNGPWREYYFTRVKRLAQTGADGVWPDVPLYFDVVYDWCDVSPWGRAAFKADTGLDVPTVMNWDNPVWRRWIAWRHRNLNQFLIDLAAAGRSVKPDFETFVETVTCDFYDATTMGLDGAYLRLAEGVTHVWEVDTVSDSDAMRQATEDDWICLISMYKYCRAASGAKPAWVFTKGWEVDDAAGVMSEALAAGCNPYEVQVPGKTVGVNPAMRTRMYAFVRTHTARIFDSTSLAQVALYHSSASRDYTPNPEQGSGKFASTQPPSSGKEWWSGKRSDSCYHKQWLGEYRGTLKALVHAHIPFDVLTSPTLRAEDLSPYRVLLLPDLEAVADDEAELLRQFVKTGGTIVITGPDPTGLNEYGDPRPEYALADVLGVSKRGRLPNRHEAKFGEGAVFLFSDLPGQQYLLNSRPADYEKLIDPVLQSVTPVVSLDGDRRIHLEARALGDATILHLVNFVGVAGDYKVVPTTATLRVVVPAGKRVQGVGVASPDQASPELAPLTFDESPESVIFTVDLQQYALVVINWQ